MEVTLVILLVLAILIVLPALIGFGIVGAFKLTERRRATAKRGAAGLVWRLDAD